MSTALAISGSTAATFLTHFLGPGPADERYVVERFQTMADGDSPLARRGGGEEGADRDGRRDM